MAKLSRDSSFTARAATTAILTLAPQWATLWASLSPEEQAQVADILSGIPELGALAAEVGLGY